MLTLVAAFGALGLIALFKAGAGKNANVGGGEQPPVAQANPNSNATGTNDQPAAAGHPGQPPVVSEEVRAALIERDIQDILDLQSQVDGSNNLVIINALLEKFSNPEAEVRQTALRVIKEMNDTNAVPGLQKAVAGTTDAREKVAIMDAIDYIKMPTMTDDVPPEMATNLASLTGPISNVQPNPAFLKGMKNARTRKNNPPAAPPQDMPANPPQ